MNKDFQLEQLQWMLMDPELSSGLYFIDKDLTDEEIEECINENSSYNM